MEAQALKLCYPDLCIAWIPANGSSSDGQAGTMLSKRKALRTPAASEQLHVARSRPW